MHEPLHIAGAEVLPGETRDLRLKVSESYTGDPVAIPIRVIRAPAPSDGGDDGPVVLITGGVHGDELNGAGIVRQLLGTPLELLRGTLVLVPIVNSFGFENHTRYLPDRRDLNRSFPGSAPGKRAGSLASRIAGAFFHEVVRQCDYGIDLHTAAVRRTNFPNVRGDLSIPAVRRIARAFGCELIVNGKGPKGSLRREACASGCPTIILEAGEVWKIEPGVVEVGVRGIRNVLIELGMLAGNPSRPAYQTRVDRTAWVRAEVGGILIFHVGPGEIVEAGQPIAANVSIVGEHQSILTAPADGIVLGMTTLPAAKPGDPVCHIAIPRRSVGAIRSRLASMPRDHSDLRIREDLATNIAVSPPGAS
jgi:uncharacterized protein